MRLKGRRPKITVDDPFAEDLLDRKVSADALLDFVSAIEEPFVLAVTAPFGGGKSTFISMWLHHIRKAGFTTLYFNAWQNDFTESPLVALIGELAGLLNEAEQTADPGKAKALLRKAKEIAPSLAKTAIPGFVRLATAGVIDISALGKDLGEIAEEIAKQQIKNYDSDKAALRKFRSTLSKFVESVRGSTSNEEPKPVVFVIDELDRCRPNYAISLLEKIKHLFNVDGLVFVLAVDRHQLAESVRALYGSGLNADGYLRRLVDLEFQLPNPDISKFAEAQFQRFGLSEAFGQMTPGVREDASGLDYILPTLCQLFSLSPRVIEQLFTHLSVVLRMTGHNIFLQGTLLAFLLVLRAVDRQLYEDFCCARTDYIAVLDRLKTFAGFSRFLQNRRGAILEAYLIQTLPDSGQRKAVFDELQQKANADSNTASSDRAREILDAVRWARSVGEDALSRLYRRIEISQRFVPLGK